MRRNRKVKKFSRVTLNSAYFVGFILLIFLAAMVYWSQCARCSALQLEIQQEEKTLKRLEGDCQREIANWEELKTQDRLRTALVRHGLDMHQPNMDQVVHMSRAGVPEPGQMSVARIRGRSARSVMVEAQPLARPRAGGTGRIPKRTGAVRR